MLHTVLFFLIALTILIAIHEYGHFWVARRLGVKVLRFSLGLGKPVWKYRKTPDSTEFTISALPLGGYVRMVDEREGPVAPADLPKAFNRKPLWVRTAVVVAGPLFNFLLAILVYWCVYMIGESGLRPVLGPVPAESLAARSGFVEGDEITAVSKQDTPTWSEAIGRILEGVLDEGEIPVTVRTLEGDTVERVLAIPGDLAEKPEELRDRLGFEPWQPSLPPIIDRIEPGSAAERAGLEPGDRLLRVDGAPIADWRQWVEQVREHPGAVLHLVVERQGVEVPLEIIPVATETSQGTIGRIGAAVQVPAELEQQMRVTYRLGIVPAFGAAVEKTADFTVLTLKMVGRMIVGKAALENLSGPLSMAQYAGQSARLGLVQFLKFLAIVSISLAVLNLLPIPILDGGHLMFYAIEWVKGSPLSEQTIAVCQQIGMFVLISLMGLALYLDLGRLLT